MSSLGLLGILLFLIYWRFIMALIGIPQVGSKIGLPELVEVRA